MVQLETFLQRQYYLCCIQDWLESYLHDRSHRVCINDTLSDQNALKCGVPQGSFLGARLYSMYVYPLSNSIKKHNLQYHT